MTSLTNDDVVAGEKDTWGDDDVLPWVLETLRSIPQELLPSARLTASGGGHEDITLTITYRPEGE
jgi:hypothetical protein